MYKSPSESIMKVRLSKELYEELDDCYNELKAAFIDFSKTDIVRRCIRAYYRQNDEDCRVALLENRVIATRDSRVCTFDVDDDAGELTAQEVAAVIKWRLSQRKKPAVAPFIPPIENYTEVNNNE